MKPADRQSESWQTSFRRGQVELWEDGPDGDVTMHPLSGNERNRLFWNGQGQGFTDISALSGLDSIADGRCLALWDFDRDGWQDVAVVNANAPKLQLFHNRLGELEEENGMIAVRFVGGNHTSARSELACRDGYGAVVSLRAGGSHIVREHRCGEGFAAQNSATMIVGLGDVSKADELIVRWPSGRSQRLQHVAEGSLVTAFEDLEHAPDGTGFSVERYRTQSQPLLPSNGEQGDLAWLIEHALEEHNFSATRQACLITTTATWCAACKQQFPQIKLLKRHFGERLAVIGVPADKEESEELLAEYETENQPPYVILKRLMPEERNRIHNYIEQSGRHAIPSSFLLNGQGKVMGSYAGVPTVSEIAHVFPSYPAE